MGRAAPALAATLALALLAPSGAPAASSPSAGGQVSARALLTSHVLWATIDVCNPADQPNTVGVRGSMPGDGRARDRMYMSFRLQYLDTVHKRWVDLENKPRPEYVAVGGAAASRQAGTSFQLMPVAGSPVQLRGVARFRWRRGKNVLVAATRVTTTGHRSVADADPAGFSAATCQLG
jgi:hypothetical protein